MRVEKTLPPRKGLQTFRKTSPENFSENSFGMTAKQDNRTLVETCPRKVNETDKFTYMEEVAEVFMKKTQLITAES